MVFVRREGGLIAGVYGAWQDYAQEELPDDNAEVLAYLSPPVSTAYRISKTTPWIRMTDDEAVLITGAMQQANARQKAIYDAASYLSSGDPLWGTLHDMIAVTLGSAARADELLAPER